MSLVRPYLIGAAVGLSVGFGGCWWLRDQMAAHAKLKAAERAVTRVVKQTEVSNKVSAKAEARQIEIRYRFKTILKEVPKYVTVEADRACTVNNGFVRLHDAAVAGSLPGAPRESDAAPSDVKLSEVSAVGVENAGAYHAVAAQLTALQEWVREQSKVR